MIHPHATIKSCHCRSNSGVSSSLLRMSSQDINSEVLQSRSKVIEKLLNKLVTLSNSTSDLSLRSLYNANSSDSMEVKPYELNFRTKHSTKIKLSDVKYAERYLSLPVSSYSLLDSKMIERSSDSSDDFKLNIPLKSFSSGYSSISGNVINLPSSVSVNINVKSTPENGKILMTSDDIYFTYDNKLPSYDDKTLSVVQNVTTPPPWLIWGGDITTATVNGSIKSSIQCKVDIQLTWLPTTKSNKQESKIKSLLGMLKKFVTNVSSRKNKSPVVAASNMETSELILNSDTFVDVELNLPLRNSRLVALSGSGPVRFLLKQIGSLFVESFISILSSNIIVLLKKNYDVKKSGWIQDDLNVQAELISQIKQEAVDIIDET